MALGLFSGVPGKALIPLGWALALLVQRHPKFPAAGVADGHAGRRNIWGAISYPLYLLNEPVQRGCTLLVAPWAAGDALLFTALWLPLAVVLTVAAAAALHRWVEMRFMNPQAAAGGSGTWIPAFAGMTKSRF